MRKNLKVSVHFYRGEEKEFFQGGLKFFYTSEGGGGLDTVGGRQYFFHCSREGGICPHSSQHLFTPQNIDQYYFPEKIIGIFFGAWP